VPIKWFNSTKISTQSSSQMKSP